MGSGVGSEGRGEQFLLMQGQQARFDKEIGKSARSIYNHLDFEYLLSEISATYINLPTQNFDDVLKNDFARLIKVLGYDLCSLCISDKNSGALTRIKPYIWFVDDSKESTVPLRAFFTRNKILETDTFPYSFRKWNKGEPVTWTSQDDFPEDAENEKRVIIEYGITATFSVPISCAGSVTGVISAFVTESKRFFNTNDSRRLRLIGEVFINAFMRKRSEEMLQKALSQIQGLKKRFEADYTYLSEEVNLDHNTTGVVGQSDAIKKVHRKVQQVAATEATVLLLGETGTGKGLIARVIHNASSRKDRPLIQVNCAAFAPTLIESELFGHEKGAYTGAASRRIGRFEAAGGTTLFLDEIGDLPLELQPKLLRILEEGEFERVGGSSTIHTDVRLITATSKDLGSEVEAGRFRRDLWYRLNLFPVIIPPLRERLDDIPLLVTHFIDVSVKWAGKRFDKISYETIKALQNYSWPGNIRELKNVIERAVITSQGNKLIIERPVDDYPSLLADRSYKALMKNTARKHVLEVLEQTHWIIQGPKGAAKCLALPPTTVRNLMNKLDIKRPY
jgi:formate hydrogenlyase transcriptional activator